MFKVDIIALIVLKNPWDFFCYYWELNSFRFQECVKLEALITPCLKYGAVG